ncbi:hypothetical protein ACW0JT_15095 [Arthrobacter sp. SA17]
MRESLVAGKKSLKLPWRVDSMPSTQPATPRIVTNARPEERQLVEIDESVRDASLPSTAPSA